MTKRDLFIFLIKLFGVVNLLPIVFQMPLFVLFEINQDGYFNEYMYPQLFNYGLLISLYLFLIFKATMLVNFLRLEEGFEEDYIYVEEITVEGALKVGLIIAGVLMMANNVPQFIQHVIYSFKLSNINAENSSFEKMNWLGSLLQAVMGYIMAVHYKWLTQLFKLDYQEPKELDDELLDDMEDD